MLCSLRTKLLGLLMRITGRQQHSAVVVDAVDLPEGKNPWQANLERMAAERDEPKLPEELDEVANFVRDLKKAAGSVDPPPQEHPLASRPKRVGDGTVTDIKSWWNESVATFDALNSKNLDSIDKKPNGRSAHRWFKV